MIMYSCPAHRVIRVILESDLQRQQEADQNADQPKKEAPSGEPGATISGEDGALSENSISEEPSS